VWSEEGIEIIGSCAATADDKQTSIRGLTLSNVFGAAWGVAGLISSAKLWIKNHADFAFEKERINSEFNSTASSLRPSTNMSHSTAS
jgi:hypothetical protein